MTEADHGSSVTEFVEWLLLHGAQFQSLELCQSDQYQGYGCIIKKPIAAGEVAIALPAHLVMDTRAVSRSEVGGHIACALKDLNLAQSEQQHVGLYIFLLFERNKGRRSLWWSYIQLLPKTVDSAIYFSEKQQIYLSGTHLLRQANEKQDYVKQLHQQVLSSKLSAQQPSLFPPENNSYDDLLWVSNVRIIRMIATYRVEHDNVRVVIYSL
jgi:hypothetical protein